MTYPDASRPIPCPFGNHLAEWFPNQTHGRGRGWFFCADCCLEGATETIESLCVRIGEKFQVPKGYEHVERELEKLDRAPALHGMKM